MIKIESIITIGKKIFFPANFNNLGKSEVSNLFRKKVKHSILEDKKVENLVSFGKT